MSDNGQQDEMPTSPKPMSTKPDGDHAGVPAEPSPRLLEFLVCPITKATLELSSDRTELICRQGRVAYPIRDGIPILVTDAARDLTDADLKK